MRVFQIRGLAGWLMMILAGVAILALLTVVPATYVLIAWNAIIHEWFKGPAIAMHQALLLWGMMISVLYITLQPEFKLEFQQVSDRPKTASAAPIEVEQNPTLSDDVAAMDNQTGE